MDAAVEDAVNLEQARGLVELVLDLGPLGDLDDDVEAAEFLRLPGLGTVSILSPFPELSEMSGT